jgi:TonB family protein
MLDDPNPSSDAYLATWKSAASDDPRPQFIGFFYYIDGAFRWNSVVHFEPRQPATGSASNPDAAHQTVAGPIEQIGKGISPPRVIHLEGAHYSPTAEKARFEGTVILSLVVDTDGLPKQIKVTRSLGMGLDEKAVEAVRQYTFEPARNSKGEPVAVAVAIEVRFKLYK